MKNKHHLQSEKTYQAFIDAIMGNNRKRDIEKFTIRSLCSSLGLSPRTFYLYFRIKTMRSCSAIARMKKNC